MAEPDLVKTGISGLDAILSGGIPRGNVILLEGRDRHRQDHDWVSSSSIAAPACSSEPGIIVLFEVSPDKLVRDAARFGWDLPALEREHQLKIIFTTRPVFRQELQQADSLLLEEAAKMGARRIFVDGVAGVIGGVGGQEPRDAFHVLVEGLQRETAHGGPCGGSELRSIGDHRAALPEESIADTVIRLRMEDARARHGADRSRSSNRAATISRWAGTRSGSSMGMASRCIAGCRPLAEQAATAPPPSTRRRASPPAFRASMRSSTAAISSAARRWWPAFRASARVSWRCSSLRKARGAASGASCSRSTSRCPR